MNALPWMPNGPATDVNDHARRLLVKQGLHVAEVVRVDAESVLYISYTGLARTAWLRLDAEHLTIRDEPGFSAEDPVATAA